ncbi:NO-inducible flavohemoprotein [Sutcliffiella horikoshii]|uniref:NO-inducible flavohemoprotein n=1 Tax=Sutcliffiella horikoshii TaxID=79883 RepID=UPI001EEE6B51|nr:NO-inducible flavohemoprotein [Sutcliffiella horikoshii]MCG1022489.1 NO-inducible flavohemoprotein [Sutcliffiella horikoshii]
MLSSKTIEIVKSTAPVLAVKGEEITTHFYKTLFTNHPELLNIFNHANQKKGRQQTALANTVYAAATYIDQLEVLLPAVKQIAHKHRSLAVKPEHYPIVGEHLLEAIKAVLGEAATDEIIEAWGEAYGVIADVFISVEKEMYEEAAQQPAGWEDFKDFDVVEKVEESELITSFYLKPSDGSAVPSFAPGQYITIRISIPGEKNLFNRQYSLSDASNGECFRISVKKENGDPDGVVSNYLHDHVEPGHTLEVTAPAGDFILETKQASPVYLISGGVGITPMLSMLKTIAKEQPTRPATFIHAARNGSVHAFKDEVREAIEIMENGKKLFVYENPSDEDVRLGSFHEQGYITENMLKGLNIDKDALFYVCGPVPFMKFVISMLGKLGVAEENIRYEFFGPSIDMKKEEEMAVK